MSRTPRVTVEFYAMARRRAGTDSVLLTAQTVAEALHVVADSFPGLAELSRGPDSSSPYLVSVNAGPFLQDWDTALIDGDRLLILSADAGG